jgi:hypothetical protein
VREEATEAGLDVATKVATVVDYYVEGGMFCHEVGEDRRIALTPTFDVDSVSANVLVLDVEANDLGVRKVITPYAQRLSSSRGLIAASRRVPPDPDLENGSNVAPLLVEMQLVPPGVAMEPRRLVCAV